MTLRVGIDVGGTFTDVVAVDDLSGMVVNLKFPSTTMNPAQGVLNAFSRFAKEHVTLVTHATTTATNALLGQSDLILPKAALITTYGFKDIVEIGRQRRAELYNLFFQKPRQLIPRRYRFEVRERIDAYGNIVTPLDADDVETVLGRVRSEGIEAIAVCFLNSYINPTHEIKVKENIEASLPGVHVCCSSEVAREYREYERFSTAVVNVMLMPIVSKYIEKLANGLDRMRISSPLLIMQSSGGMASTGYVSAKPASIIESGPAAGVVASAFYSGVLGIDNVISFDMGGTTAKAGAIRGGVIEVTSEYEVAGGVHKGRITKGSGYPVRGSFVDLAECSAGGGTIAWVDEGGALRVGPLSAGASPGPACYGTGGTDATVTDANLLLGRLNPKHLLNGEKPINIDLARRAVEEKICGIVRMPVVDAASGIVKIVNSKMAKIISMVSIERGYDPVDFAIIAFGGAGPMHVCSLAEDIGIGKIVVPPNPGLFSAFGLLVSDLRYETTRAVMAEVGSVQENLEMIFADMERDSLNTMSFFEGNITVDRYLDMRYVGQSYELLIPVGSPTNKSALEDSVKRFHERHRDVYGHSAKDADVEVVNARVVAVGVVEKPKLNLVERGGSKPTEESIVEERKVFFEGAGGFVECPVFRREKLKSGNTIAGPAIIEQYDSTTVVYPRWTAEIDDYANVILRR